MASLDAFDKVKMSSALMKILYKDEKNFAYFGGDIVAFKGITGFYLITYFGGGYSLWKFHLLPLKLTSGEFMCSVMFISILIFSVPMSVYNVYVSYRDKTGNNLSFWEGSRPMVPSFILFILLLIWELTSPFDIIRRQPRIFYFLTGVVFSNITCRLMVNCMSHTRCQAFNWLLLPLMAIVVGVNTLELGIMEVYFLYAYTIFASASHLHYGICVVKQLAKHFKIHVFSTKRPTEKLQSSNGVSSQSHKT